MLPQTQPIRADYLYILKDAPVIQLPAVSAHQGSQSMTVRKNGVPLLIRYDDIVRCESASNYSFIYYGSGQKVIVARTLKMIGKSLLPLEFVRVHRSHLVKRDDIDFVLSDRLLLKNGDEVPVSRSFRRKKLERIV